MKSRQAGFSLVELIIVITLVGIVAVVAMSRMLGPNTFNAPIVREWIEAHNVSIQVGDVFKHMNLPRFDAEDPQHQRLAQLSQQAHQTHNDVARAAVVAQIEPVSLAVLTSWLNR